MASISDAQGIVSLCAAMPGSWGCETAEKKVTGLKIKVLGRLCFVMIMPIASVAWHTCSLTRLMIHLRLSEDTRRNQLVIFFEGLLIRDTHAFPQKKKFILTNCKFSQENCMIIASFFSYSYSAKWLSTWEFISNDQIRKS